MFNLAPNPPFCQTAVMPSPLFSVVFVRCHIVPVMMRWLGSFFAVYCLALCVWKTANMLPIALG
ncbi:MAG: hypothetical protein KDC72_06715 [Bacteroidetes bacterium]|nr:hypothetical protein [Bacteroidota bacterium]